MVKRGSGRAVIVPLVNRKKRDEKKKKILLFCLVLRSVHIDGCRTRYRFYEATLISFRRIFGELRNAFSQDEASLAYIVVRHRSSIILSEDLTGNDWNFDTNSRRK